MAGVGEEILELARELAPFCRSITGDGVRRTLDVIGERVPELNQVEVATGTSVLDWQVPREWNLAGATVTAADGRRVIDSDASWLHVVGYSVPFRGRVTREELDAHLHSLPEQPSLVPYRTSYYNEQWGFCLAHEDRLALPDGEFDVVVDSRLEDGALTYGEIRLPGATTDEVLVSCHVCHPTLANDGLSAMAVAATLARHLSGRENRLSYRFLFAPGTIGAVTWLARNEERLDRIVGGLVLACLGDPGGRTYKRSRRGNAPIDRAVEHVLKHSSGPSSIRDFTPTGYDERQFCSPGFDLPMGCFMRTPPGEFPEYHTSADDLDFVSADALADSFATIQEVFEVLEADRTYLNLAPKGEPRLGARGLYRAVGGDAQPQSELALLWVLNQSDGEHSLLDVAERSGLPFAVVAEAADRLVQAELLAPAGGAA